MHSCKNVGGWMTAGIVIDGNVIDARNRLDDFWNQLVMPAKGKVGHSVIGKGRGSDIRIALERRICGDREVFVVLEINFESVFAVIVDGLSWFRKEKIETENQS